jgi:hypothetical protein
MSVDPATGAYEVFAMGLREPNGIGIGPDNELFIPDVQGNWLPSCKLINIRKGRFYGFKHEPAEAWDTQKEYPPAVYLPQVDLAQAPGTPLLINKGNLAGDRFVGQMLLGDAVNGGIRRVFLDKMENGEYQGAVFAFTGGLEAGPNRMAWGPDGYLYVGMCGQGSPDWAYKKDFGLQKIKPNGKDVFEMVAVRARAGGLEIEFTHEVNAAGQLASAYKVKSWYYQPTSAYGGAAQGVKVVEVGTVVVSPDKKSVFLPLNPMDTATSGNGRVYDIKLTGVASATGVANWTTEAWYTLNSASTRKPFEAATKLAPPAPLRSGGLVLRALPGRLDVTMALNGIGGVQVRNAGGTLVAEVPGNGGKTLRIPTSGWARGVYLVSVRSGAATQRRAVAIP